MMPYLVLTEHQSFEEELKNINVSSMSVAHNFHLARVLIVLMCMCGYMHQDNYTTSDKM
jgi:hypothetical protein